MIRALLIVIGLAGLLALAGALTAADPPKGNLVEIDLSKLPPDLAKRLQEAAKAAQAKEPKEPKKSTPAVKAISLVEAIVIAEKLAKGTATKAERKDNPQVHFKIDVLDKDGKKAKIELAADGKLEKKEDEDEKPAATPATPAKGKGKQ